MLKKRITLFYNLLKLPNEDKCDSGLRLNMLYREENVKRKTHWLNADITCAAVFRLHSLKLMNFKRLEQINKRKITLQFLEIL